MMCSRVDVRVRVALDVVVAGGKDAGVFSAVGIVLLGNPGMRKTSDGY